MPPVEDPKVATSILAPEPVVNVLGDAWNPLPTEVSITLIVPFKVESLSET